MTQGLVVASECLKKAVAEACPHLFAFPRQIPRLASCCHLTPEQLLAMGE